MPSIDTFDTLRDFIAEELHWNGNVSDLTGDYPLIESHVLDSMGVYLLIAFLENDFGLKIADTDLVLDNFSTMSKIAAMIDNKRGAKKPAGNTDAP
jgi:acyl carrier protein